MTQHEEHETFDPQRDRRWVEDDAISLTAMIATIWRYRKTVAGTIAGILLLFLFAAAGLFLLAPAERVATMQFRLLFDGADRGQYPNGTAFRGAEIIASPVLSEVFETNELQRFGTFHDFKNAVFIVETSAEADLLGYEYQKKLTDAKLTPVDRARIEDEFRRKREALPVEYALSFRRWERVGRMQSELMSKVLEDTLAIWARQAAERKGALKYNVSVLSRNILPQGAIESEDYIIVVDMLRSKILRILANIDAVSTLPGAAVVRVGSERISLAEARANLEDVYRFKVQPLIGMIRSTGLSKDPEMAVLYLENQLFQNRLESNEAAGKVRTLQASLRQYMQEERVAVSMPQTPAGQSGGQAASSGGLGVPALIPQFGESFLDRLVQMSSQNNDVRFRQDITERVIGEGVKAVSLEKDTAYYEDLIAALRGTLQRSVAADAVRERAGAIVKTRAEESVQDIRRWIDQVNAIYEELSARQLNPSTLLYAVTKPFTVRTTRALSVRTLAMAGALVFLVSLFLVPLSCLFYDHMRRELAGSTQAAGFRAPNLGFVEGAPQLAPAARGSANRDAALE
jgi:hypothetical protein